LGPLTGALGNPGIEESPGKLRRQTLRHLLEEIPSLVLRGALDLGEGVHLIDVPMVKALGQLFQVALQVTEIIDHPGSSYFRSLDYHLNHVTMAVETGALAHVITKEVGGIVVSLDGNRVHG
jgi:hypothetical protein